MLVSLVACNMFRLRDAEDPAKPPDWNEPCITWEQNFQNLQYATGSFQNWNRYEGQFTDDFRFYFSPEDIHEYGTGTEWNRTTERDALYSMHSWADTMNVAFAQTGTQDFIGENDVKIYRSYTLNVVRNSVPSAYRGNLEIHFRKQNGIWRIRRWYDYRVNPYPTWGKLKYDVSH